MAQPIDLSLPAGGWRPRRHQHRLWRYLENGGRRALAVWHRRAGKDEICLHYTAVAAHERKGNYWHCLPEYSQGRKAIWTAINAHTGRRRIDEAFPPELRENTSDNEMFIRFKNGSTWQVIGSDRFDTTVGAGVAGITYSEWALANPSAWGYHRPMLEENNGWAAFITTPRGRNHAKSMFDYALDHPKEWFAERLTVEDTKGLSKAQLDEAMAEYQALYGEDVGRAQFEQEYLCSFNAAILGAYYALEMARVHAEGRIVDALDVPVGTPVHRAWDIGVGDDTAIWWFAVVGPQVYVVDHYTANNVGVEHFAEVIEARKHKYGWRDGTDWVPHDAKIKEWGSGRTRVETMSGLGLHPQLVPFVSIADGREAVRQTLRRAVFHRRCDETQGIAALEQYRREWDDERKAFRETHVHDWTSHPADAFRYLSLAWRPASPLKPREPNRVPGAIIIPLPTEPKRGLRI